MKTGRGHVHVAGTCIGLATVLQSVVATVSRGSHFGQPDEVARLILLRVVDLR